MPGIGPATGRGDRRRRWRSGHGPTTGDHDARTGEIGTAPSVSGAADGAASTETAFVLVTGMSGAGRSTAAKALEDLGWFVVDNLPPGLLAAMAELARAAQAGRRQVAAVVDVRSLAFTSDLDSAIEELERAASPCACCSWRPADEVLVRRFENVRRAAPAAGRRPPGRRDRRASASCCATLRAKADLVIDTSDLNVHELRGKIDAVFGGEDRPGLRVNVVRSATSTACRSTRTWSSTAGSCPTPTGSPSCARMTGLDPPSGSTCSTSRVRGVPRRLRGAARVDLRRLHPRGQALRDARRRLHRRQASQRRHGRGDRRPAARQGVACECARDSAGSEAAGVNEGLKIVALGGGHGLTPRCPRCGGSPPELTAVVTVADDGGSSGRLRRELGVLPPGDLRMALAALCGDDEWGRTWSEVVQHRFRSERRPARPRGRQPADRRRCGSGSATRSPGSTGSARLLGAHGRVLPMASVPLDIAAEVRAGPADR